MQNIPEAEEPLRIIALEARNVKRLKAVSITPNGDIVAIGGRNAQGKTSVLDSIMLALGGEKYAKAAKLVKPIRDGESKAEIAIDLGEFKITKTYTPSGGTLTVRGADGLRHSSPQAVLDGLIGDIAFDPLAFTRMKSEDQLATLREVAGINTAMIDSSRKAAFDDRTDANRKVKELSAQVSGLPFFKDVPEEEVSAKELSAQLKQANESNAALAELVRNGRTAVQTVNDLKEEIAELEENLKVKREMLQTAENKLVDLRANAAGKKEIDTSYITGQLDDITATNRKVAGNKTRADAVEALETWTKKAEDLTEQIEKLDARKRDKLEKANYPVPGLRLDDDGVKYNGIPFSQSSAAEQLRVSVAMGLAMNPRLRVILIRDGSLLDEDSLEILRQIAEEKQAQVWIERVGKGEECCVIIEDGEVEEVRA